MDAQAARQQAQDYLARVLGARAPVALQLAGAFAERPLEDEGPTWLFSFELPDVSTPGPAACAAGERRHYVAAGETEPNYFPAYGLAADAAYSFHIGTRFMLAMQMQKVDASLEPPGAREALRTFVARYAQGAVVEAEALAGLFRCEEAYFAVYRLRLDGAEFYCLGADCPPGFYPLAQHPPQMVLRLHLGNVIRAEARREGEPSARSGDRDRGDK